MSAGFITVMGRSAIHSLKKQAVEHPYVLPLWVFVGAQFGMGVFTSAWTMVRKTDIVAARWNHYDRVEAIDFTNPRQQKLFPLKKEKLVYQPRDENVQELYDLIYADGDYKR